MLLTTGDSRAFDSIRGRHGYVLTFENVSNAQWIGSKVGLSPPNIGLLTLNALVTSDLVLIPVQCEFFPMEGLPTLIKVMDLVKSRLRASFDFRVVLTMFDGRTALSRKVQSQVWSNFGQRALKTVIPRSVRMAEAPSKGLPGIVYRPKNPASEQYRALTKELLRIQLPVEA